MKRYRIIDGYNFLHAAGMMPRKIDGETLERARSQLVRYLSVRLTDQERALTTLVFDVNQNLGNLTARKVEAGMTILLAINYPDADSLIEELLKSHSAPKQVTVISSDHRLHRAARARRATPVDSEVFYRLMEEREILSTSRETDANSIEMETVSDLEVEMWQQRIQQLFDE